MKAKSKEGKNNFERSEVLEAERLNPSLTKCNPKSVLELKVQLGAAARKRGVVFGRGTVEIRELPRR
jgi:hypothetical protein